jgi:hypothetical protein
VRPRPSLAAASRRAFEPALPTAIRRRYLISELQLQNVCMIRLFVFLLPMAAFAAFTPPLPLVALTKKTQIDVLPLQHLMSPITLNVVCLGCSGDGNQIFVSESAVRLWLQRALARTHVVRVSNADS